MRIFIYRYLAPESRVEKSWRMNFSVRAEHDVHLKGYIRGHLRNSWGIEKVLKYEKKFPIFLCLNIWEFP